MAGRRCHAKRRIAARARLLQGGRIDDAGLAWRRKLNSTSKTRSGFRGSRALAAMGSNRPVVQRVVAQVGHIAPADQGQALG
jgi:hypothetical protein